MTSALLCTFSVRSMSEGAVQSKHSVKDTLKAFALTQGKFNLFFFSKSTAQLAIIT